MLFCEFPTKCIHFLSIGEEKKWLREVGGVIKLSSQRGGAGGRFVNLKYESKPNVVQGLSTKVSNVLQNLYLFLFFILYFF